MLRNRLLGTLALCFATALLLSHRASAQEFDVEYYFTQAEDGENWPDGDGAPLGIPSFGSYTTEDGVRFTNNINNVLFVDDNFLMDVFDLNDNSGGFSQTFFEDDIVWGDPKGSNPTFSIDFEQADMTASFVQFDFGWTANDATPNFTVWDSEGESVQFGFGLGTQFNPGFAYPDSEGWGDQLQFFYDDFNDLPGTSLIDIARIEIDLNPVSTNTGTEQFAIDNFGATLDMENMGSGGGGGNPDQSDLRFGSSGQPEIEIVGLGTKYLVNSINNGSFDVAVVNDGIGDTTYSLAFSGIDSIYTPGTLPTGEPILGSSNEEIDPYIQFTTFAQSGEYDAQLDLTNLQKVGDTAQLLTTVELYDAPDVTDDTGDIVDPSTDGQISMSNAPAGPHSGALRAGLEINAIVFSDPGFSLTGINPLDFLAPGTSLNGQVHFDPTGLPAGSYGGTLNLKVAMNSEAGSFLNGKPPVPDYVWNIANQVIPVTENASDNASPGQDLGELGLGVQNNDTAADILGGTSTANQSISLDLDPDTGGFGIGFENTANVLSDPVDVDLGNDGDVFVLQLVFDGAGLNETQKQKVRLLFYDEGTDTWQNAIEFNSNFKAVQLIDNAINSEGRFFADTSYEQYMLDGGTLTPGAHGTTVNGVISAWAIVDHNTVFGAGIIPEPASMGLLLVGAMAMVSRRRR